MTREELEKLEESMMGADIATDGKKRKARKKAVTNKSLSNSYKNIGLWVGIIIACIIIATLIALIISSITNMQSANQNNQNNLGDFEILQNSQVQQVSVNEIPTQQTEALAYDATLNPYYLSASLASSKPEDTLFQVGDVVYNLPLKLNELESNGITLITLGNQPPADNITLDAGTRNGFIQFGEERYEVTLKNGSPCNYHELTLVGIRVNCKPGCSFYAFSGFTIGSEEASIPMQSVVEMSTDKPFSTHTYYQWGNVENYNQNHTGKYICLSSDNTYGKIDEIFIYDDATITGY